eukprot:4653386-Alexandrium_andersonii.AAC.1
MYGQHWRHCGVGPLFTTQAGGCAMHAWQRLLIQRPLCGSPSIRGARYAVLFLHPTVRLI